MKKHKWISIALFLLIFIIPLFVHAQLKLNAPKGGKVVKTQTDLQSQVVCAAASGAFMIKPFNTAVPGPYFIRATTRGMPKKDGFILGLYKIIPDLGTCVNPATGVPVPAFEVKLYGVSK
jgi:hypothetical protein